jgi:hypothetical protein
MITDILKKFDSKQCNITWNNKNNSWFFVNFFPSNNYRQKTYLSDNKFITPNKMIPVTTDIEPFIRVFSDKKEGCSVIEIAKSNKFSIGKMSKGGSGCKHCGFGKRSIIVKNKESKFISLLKKDLIKLKMF